MSETAWDGLGAFYDGALAASQGKLMRHCPYDLGTLKQRWWYRGFLAWNEGVQAERKLGLNAH